MVSFTTSNLAFLLFTIVTPILTSDTLLSPKQAKDLALKLSTGSQRGIDTEITEKLHNLSSNCQHTLSDALDRYPDLINMAEKFEDIDENVWYVDHAYRHTAEYIGNPSKYHLTELNYIANAFSDLVNTVEMIHQDFAGNGTPEDGSILSVLANNPNPKTNCVTSQSSEELINKLYEIVVLSEVEALVVLLCSNDLEEKLEGRPVKNVKDEVINNSTTRISHTLQKVQKALDFVSQKITQCNVVKQEENK